MKAARTKSCRKMARRGGVVKCGADVVLTGEIGMRQHEMPLADRQCCGVVAMNCEAGEEIGEHNGACGTACGFWLLLS